MKNCERKREAKMGNVRVAGNRSCLNLPFYTSHLTTDSLTGAIVWRGVLLL